MDTKALRQKILDLAIRGKLVPQDPNDEPASVLLERIREQKMQMVKEGKLKAKDIKNDTIIFAGEDNLHYEKFQDGTVKCIEDEIPFEVPEGWEWERLGNVSTIARGGSPRPIEDYLTDNVDGINWIKIGDTEKDGKYILHTKEKIKPAGLSKTRYVQSGDFLLTNSMSFGRPYILKTNGCIHDGWLVIGNIDTVFNQDYLYYALSSGFMYTTLSLLAAGSTVKNLKSETVRSVLFPIPPFGEQERMARRLEQLIILVNTINAEKGQLADIINQTKSKILDLAIRGKLVPQDPNDEPASVLLELIRTKKEELIKQGKIKRDKKESVIFKGDDNSYYEKIGDEVRCIDEEIPFDIPDNWEWIRLKNICDKIIDGSHNPPKGMDNITPFIMASSRNINFDTLWDLENVRYLCQRDYKIENERTNIKIGDILLTTVATLGRSCIYNGFPKNLCFQRSVTVISTDIVPEYLKLFLDAPYFQKFIFNNATGTAQKGFYLNQLENVLVCVPPLSEQTRMLQTADAVLKQLLRLEESLN